MPNFDSLRSSIITPLAYICRPKEKPAALLGLWTLGDGVTTDLSRYGGGVCNFAITPTSTTEYGFPLAVGKFQGSAVTMNMGTTLDMSKDWSWEGYFRDASNRPYTFLSLADLTVSAGHHDDPDGEVRIVIAGTAVFGGSWRNVAGILHRAVQYTASDTTIRVYKNGVLQASRVYDLSGRSTSVFTYTFSTGAGSSDAWYGVGNFRICQKALGTSTTFPTPTGLYTGYEVL